MAGGMSSGMRGLWLVPWALRESQIGAARHQPAQYFAPSYPTNSTPCQTPFTQHIDVKHPFTCYLNAMPSTATSDILLRLPLKNLSQPFQMFCFWLLTLHSSSPYKYHPIKLNCFISPRYQQAIAKKVSIRRSKNLSVFVTPQYLNISI